MKKFYPFFILLIALFSFQFTQGQNTDLQGFALTGKNRGTIEVNQKFTKTSEIFPLEGKISTIFGLAVKADIAFASEKSQVKIVLIDKFQEEYLVYESYPLLEENPSFSIDNLCEETSILSGVIPQSLRIELTDATLSIGSITYSSAADQNVDVKNVKKEKKELQNNRKIGQINKSIKSKGLVWVAGETQVSSLSYAEKKKLFGQSTFAPGIEYYVGGVLQSGDGMNLKSATASAMVENWDWRNRQGKNWITSTKNQGLCGSCWSFAATGATEAQVNLFYNQLLNMDLSEQNLLSCSGAGTCSGGYPSIALDFIKNSGIVNEEAFAYSATDQSCTNKSSQPSELIKIGGRVDFGSSAYPVSEDNLKKMLIKYGPLSGGLLDWSHAMTLVGWQVVKEGDRFFYRNLNKSTFWYTVPAGSTLIGKTVWIFKNSWGVWGDGGFVYVETAITNFAWTHALTAPVQSLKQSYTVQCVDNDNDGFYWWGLGAKPAGSPTCPDTPDGDDTNAALGPLDSYGNCIVLNAAPVAEFKADETQVNKDGSANFTDLSGNAPTSWTWTFEGGFPASSSSANPVVAYKTAGTYAVSLLVANANGKNSLLKTSYITVTAFTPTYCTSTGNATKEWISQVSLNGSTLATNSSGSLGYADLTGHVFNATVNGTNSLSLTPKFSGKSNYWYWKVWIDLNQDADFEDAGEEILSVSRSKTAFTRNILIPSTALIGATRMRISMKRNALPSACEIYPYGEVKDYTINISAPLAESSSYTETSAPMAEISSNTEISSPLAESSSNTEVSSPVAEISSNTETSSPLAEIQSNTETSSPVAEIRSYTEISTPEIGQPQGLTIYPNPAEQVLNVKLGSVFDQDSYSIYNVQGSLMLRSTLTSTLSEVDVTHLIPGIYMVKVKNGTQSFQEKFIKK